MRILRTLSVAVATSIMKVWWVAWGQVLSPCHVGHCACRHGSTDAYYGGWAYWNLPLDAPDTDSAVYRR